MDKGREFIRKEFQDYCLQTGVLLEYAALTRRSKSPCPNALEELLQLWCGVCLPTAGCQSFCGES